MYSDGDEEVVVVVVVFFLKFGEGRGGGGGVGGRRLRRRFLRVGVEKFALFSFTLWLASAGGGGAWRSRRRGQRDAPFSSFENEWRLSLFSLFVCFLLLLLLLLFGNRNAIEQLK